MHNTELDFNVEDIEDIDYVLSKLKKKLIENAVEDYYKANVKIEIEWEKK